MLLLVEAQAEKEAALPGRLSLEPCNCRPQFVHIGGEPLRLRRSPRPLRAPRVSYLPPRAHGRCHPMAGLVPGPSPTPGLIHCPLGVCWFSWALVSNLASPSSLWQEITATGPLWLQPHCLWPGSVEPRRTASSTSNFIACRGAREGGAPAKGGLRGS